MVDVLRLQFEREHLAKMAVPERALFFLLGSAANQVNVLWKAVNASLNTTSSNRVAEHVVAAQTQILLRLLIGVLWEAWRLVDQRLLSTPMGREIVPHLDRQATDALSRLKRSFGASGMIAKVRNSYAFHHPTNAEVEAAFQAALASDVGPEGWSTYFSRRLLNCFFFASELVTANGVAIATGEGEFDQAYRKLLGAVAPTVSDLSEVQYGVALVMFRKYLPAESLSMTLVAKLKDAPDLTSLRLPYFVQT